MSGELGVRSVQRVPVGVDRVGVVGGVGRHREHRSGARVEHDARAVAPAERLASAAFWTRLSSVSTTSLPGTGRPAAASITSLQVAKARLPADEHVVLGGLDAGSAVARAEVADGVRREAAPCG